MSDSLKLYQELKAKVDKAQRRRDKTKGRLEQLLDDLAYKHNCDNAKSAAKKLKTIEQKIIELEETLDARVAAFDAEYGELLDEL